MTARRTDALRGPTCLKCERPSGTKGDVDICRVCKVELFRMAFDWEWAARSIFKIEHRDQAGRVVPFVFNNAQKELMRTLYRIMFLEIIMQYDAALRGEPTYIPNIIERVETMDPKVAPIYPWEIRVALRIGKSRRRGMSAVVQAIGQLFMVCTGNYASLLMAHAGKSAEEIGRMSTRYYDHWDQGYIHHRPSTKHDSVLRLEFSNESRRTVWTAGSKGEKDASRGWHFNFYHFSEYAYYASYSEVIACGAVAPPNAWTIRESTGNGPTGDFYVGWQNAMSIDEAEDAWFNKDYERLASWGMPKHEYKIFFSWLDDAGLTASVSDWEHADLDNLDEYEKALKERHPTKFTRNKIKWRRATIMRECQGHPLPAEAYFSQEFPADEAEMFQATGAKVYSRYPIMIAFDAESKNAALVKAKFDGYLEPQHGVLANFNTLIYVPPRKTHRYIIGVDTSYGIGQDWHYALVLDRHDGTFFEEVASIYDRQMDAKAFGHVVTTIAELYNDAFIVPELQGGGLSFSQTVCEENRYTKVYQRRTYGQLGQSDSNVFRYGIFSSPPVKDAMVQTTRAIFDAKTIRLRTPFLIKQLWAYEFIDKKYSKPNGGDDDGVDALHLALFGARFAPPIKGYMEAAVDQIVEAIENQFGNQHQAAMRAVAKKIGASINAARRAGGNFRESLEKKIGKRTSR